MEPGLLLLLGLTATSAAGFAPYPNPGALEEPVCPRGPLKLDRRGTVKRLWPQQLPHLPHLEVLGRTGDQAGLRSGRARGSPHAHRPRRCTCFTYKDKECVYYCHLDIIWINTPDKSVCYLYNIWNKITMRENELSGPPVEWKDLKIQTVPYGLSNYRGSLRGKRSSGPFPESSQPSPRTHLRCACVETDDKACAHFCTHTTGVASDSRRAEIPAEEEKRETGGPRQRLKSRTDKGLQP